MHLIPCDETRHGQDILAILNHEILHSTALFDYTPRTSEDMRRWFEHKRNGDFPVLGVIDDNDRVLGFASYGTFRAWPAYKYTVEHSIYVNQEHRGKGLGDRLMQGLIAEATNHGLHVLVAGIESSNTTSIRLHHKYGFTSCGRITQAGFKFGRWLDLDFMQLTLPTPSAPRDG